MPTGELWSLLVGVGLVCLGIVFLVLELIMETAAKQFVMPVSIANLHRVCLVALSGGILVLVMVVAKWLGFLGT